MLITRLATNNLQKETRKISNRVCVYQRHMGHECGYIAEGKSYYCRICKKWVCGKYFKENLNKCLKCNRLTCIAKVVAKNIKISL